MFGKLTIILIVFSFILFPQNKKKEAEMKIKIESPSFKEGEMIPVRYTCDGENVSPAVKWSGAPGQTKSFAILCDDPDAPIGDWVHWILFNIPADITEIKENISPDKKFSNGMAHGLTDFKSFGYGGPCPPSGTHRYFFKIYALDIMLKADPGIKKKELLKLIEGHILAKGELIGRYKRK